MKKKSRYPRIATAVATALLSAHGAMAKTTVSVPPPVVPRAGVVAPHMTEAAKIQALIGSIEHLQGAVFIRNGSEYDAAKAADHLRRKLDYAGDKIRTAEQFIDKLASESSMSGKPYQIRFADGRTVKSADFFHEQLKRLEGLPAPKVVSKG